MKYLILLLVLGCASQTKTKKLNYLENNKNYRIALISSTKNHSSILNIVENEIAQKLLELKIFEVIERKELEKVLNEITLTNDTLSFEEFGKVINAELLGIYNVDDFVKKKEKVCIPVIFHHEIICKDEDVFEITISFKIIDLKTYKVIYANSGSSKAYNLDDCIKSAIDEVMSKLEGG
ncbi:MAG: hypothetical protein ABIL49_05590 [candidate division WOR-3 bacterium]|jgi:hypothetical protein